MERGRGVFLDIDKTANLRGTVETGGFTSNIATSFAKIRVMKALSDAALPNPLGTIGAG